MSLCKFAPLGKHQIRCTACNKTLPRMPNWQSIKANCTGPINPGKKLGEWDLSQPVILPRVDSLCQFRGDLLRLQECKPCQAMGKKAIEVFGCQKHVECTAHNTSIQPRIKACSTCQDFRAANVGPSPFTGPVTRNLLFFVCPKRGPEWRRNVDQVSQRMHLFNGKRIVAIATDYSTDSVDDVLEAVDSWQPQVVHFSNDRRIGEVVAFRTLLDMVQTDNPDEITYYCHAKGVTHEGKSGLPFIQRWTDAMHEVLLDGIDAVEHSLQNHTFAGAFRAIGRQFGNLPAGFNNWHYPGTFYWFRNRAAFASPSWTEIPTQYYGTEAWPGIVAPLTKSACLLADRVGLGTLYHESRWQANWQPALDRWRARQVPELKEVRRHDLPPVTLATVVFGPSAACVANVNQIFADATSHLGPTTQTIVIDNSPQPTEGIVADVCHWNGGENNFWGGAINQAVQLATGAYFIHFSARRTRVRNQRWMRTILAPLSDPSCGMAGPVQACYYGQQIGETNPRPGQPEMHVQQSIFAARTEVLRRFPWGDKFPHVYSDVWQSWSLINGGMHLVNVPDVGSSAGMEKCTHRVMVEAVTEKL